MFLLPDLEKFSLQRVIFQDIPRRWLFFNTLQYELISHKILARTNGYLARSWRKILQEKLPFCMILPESFNMLQDNRVIRKLGKIGKSNYDERVNQISGNVIPHPQKNDENTETVVVQILIFILVFGECAFECHLNGAEFVLD